MGCSRLPAVFVGVADLGSVGVFMGGSQIEGVDASDLAMNNGVGEFGNKAVVATFEKQGVAGSRDNFYAEFGAWPLVFVGFPFDVTVDQFIGVLDNLLKFFVGQVHSMY